MGVLSKMRAYVASLGIKDSDTQRDSVLTMLDKNCQSAHIGNTTRLTTTYGPKQHIVKAQNRINRRMVRIEIPRVFDKDNLILVETLEKSHDLEENLDRFYIGEGKYVTYNTLVEMLNSGLITGWLTEYVNRDGDKNRMTATRLHEKYVLPEQGNLNWAIIEEINCEVKYEDGGYYKVKLDSVNDFIHADIKDRDLGLYKPGRIFVVNYAGKYTALTFNNAKKFMTFDKSEWSELCKLNNFYPTPSATSKIYD